MSIAMERFFTPIRRYQDVWDGDGYDGPFEYTEVELAISVEEFLSYSWDWKDLCAFAWCDDLPKIIWITPYEFLDVRKNITNIFQFPGAGLRITLAAAMLQGAAIGQDTNTLMLLQHSHPANPTGACNIFWRAITRSNMAELSIKDCRSCPGGLPSGPILSQFLRGSPLLRRIRMRGFDFKEEHCRALATLERLDLKVKLSECSLDTDYTFVEWFRHNQVIMELERCDMDYSILLALSGNHSLKSLILEHSREHEMEALAQALPGNMGIEHLAFGHFQASDETWILLFRSLSRHPCIEHLSIPHQTSISPPQFFSAASKTARMQAVLEMLRHNTVVHTIDFTDQLIDHAEVYLNVILPRLEMNRSGFEVQRQALKRSDSSIRPQLLGRALYVVQYNPNLVFQFLSENVPAFVRTEEEEEASDIPLQNDSDIVSGQKRKAS
jgi:hypothetical protein